MLAPAAIVAATGVIALGGGGLGGLGSLSQLVTGPSLPGSSARSTTGARAGGSVTAVPVPLLASLPASSGSAGATGGAGRSVTGGGGTGPTSGPGTEGGGSPTGGGPSAALPGGGTGGGGTAPGGGGAPAPPATPPTPLTQVGNAVQQIAAPLPEPVRSTINQLADTVTGPAGRALGGG